MRKVISSDHIIPIITILAFSFFALVDLLQPGIPLTHDGKDHLARIANFYANLSEGILIPRWAANLNWGFGHPVLMFLYPLPSYLASVFHFFGFNLSDSLKLVFATTYIASGFGMYLWLRTFLAKYPSLLGGILYLFLPYRFVDLYVRGAIGEHVAFVFPPLLFLFSTLVLRRKLLGYVLTSLSMAGLLLSHNAISIMFLPIFIMWFVLQFFIHRKAEILIGQLISVGVGFGLSAFFLIPAFIEGKYTLRDIVTGGGEYADRFVQPIALLYGKWNYGISGQFTTELGIVGIFWALIGILLLLRMRNSKKKIHNNLLIFWYVVLMVSVFLTVGISKPIYEFITTLQKFQFPWRFLSVGVFSLSVISAITVSYINTKYQRILVLLSLILIAFFAYPQIKAKGYLDQPDSFYKSVYHGTTDTGESAPIWSVRFMEKQANYPAEIISGIGNIDSSTKKTTEHIYKVDAKSEIRIVDNTLYFPNWEVYVDDSKVPIQYQDPNHRGLITFDVSEGNHIVKVVFNNTKIRTLSNTISFSTVMFILILIITKHFGSQKFKKFL